jgi:uncharacterized protein
MKLHHPEAVYIDLLHPATFRQFQGYPERLYQLLEGNKNASVVVIDEVQKNPILLSVVHSIIEEKRGIKFILTGSSSRKLKRTGADLLGGRAMKRMLHPYIAAELGSAFNFKQALSFGLIPVILGAKNPRDALEAYVSIYLQEEIYAERLVRHLDGFVRFLEAISFCATSCYALELR